MSGYVVLVDFRLKPGARAVFRNLIDDNARQSAASNPDVAGSTSSNRMATRTRCSFTKSTEIALLSRLTFALSIMPASTPRALASSSARPSASENSSAQGLNSGIIRTQKTHGPSARRIQGGKRWRTTTQSHVQDEVGEVRAFHRRIRHARHWPHSEIRRMRLRAIRPRAFGISLRNRQERHALFRSGPASGHRPGSVERIPPHRSRHGYGRRRNSCCRW